MKCQILFSEKNKKNISKCRLLKILPRVLSVKYYNFILKKKDMFNVFWHSVEIILAYFLYQNEHLRLRFDAIPQPLPLRHGSTMNSNTTVESN